MMQTEENKSGETGRRGRLFEISAPSGTGKTTLCEALRNRFPELCYSVSYTTRAPRAGEVEGKDYHFISVDAFRKGIEENRWVEWAEVYGNYYGTSAFTMEEILASGRDLLLEIDVQGMRQIVERFPETVTIFILPPSMDALRARLVSRGTDTPEAMERRMADAAREMACRDDYRYRIVNDDLERAKNALIHIVEACMKGEDPEQTDYL
ncbi:guanylate kinase [Desulfobotulus alkaliphilus]|nr:guanylate kinase [Desulfobotulus alkaliphilus]